MNTDRSQEIRDRTFAFACRVARLCLQRGGRTDTLSIVVSSKDRMRLGLTVFAFCILHFELLMS